MAKLLPNAPLGIVFQWNAPKLMLFNNKVINVLLVTFIITKVPEENNFPLFCLNLINIYRLNEIPQVK